MPSAPGVALAQKAYDTHESSEKAALKERLSSLDGVWSRGPTCC
jgi:hypothetical protein